MRFLDIENPANNDFLVINQFKVELTSGRGHVIPDAVLFVNGIPLSVAEFKSPGIENSLQDPQGGGSLPAVLLSLNGDFADIGRYPPTRYLGIVSIQLHNHPEIIPIHYGPEKLAADFQTVEALAGR